MRETVAGLAARCREAERERDENRRKGESLCSWIGVLLTSLHVSTPEAACERVVALEADLALMQSQAEHQESEHGLTLDVIRHGLAEAERDRDAACRKLAALGLVRHAGAWITREEAAARMGP